MQGYEVTAIFWTFIVVNVSHGFLFYKRWNLLNFLSVLELTSPDFSTFPKKYTRFSVFIGFEVFYVTIVLHLRDFLLL